MARAGANRPARGRGVRGVGRVPRDVVNPLARRVGRTAGGFLYVVGLLATAVIMGANLWVTVLLWVLGAFQGAKRCRFGFFGR